MLAARMDDRWPAPRNTYLVLNTFSVSNDLTCIGGIHIQTSNLVNDECADLYTKKKSSHVFSIL